MLMGMVQGMIVVVGVRDVDHVHIRRHEVVRVAVHVLLHMWMMGMLLRLVLGRLVLLLWLVLVLEVLRL